jgi:hypothetical protein
MNWSIDTNPVSGRKTIFRSMNIVLSLKLSIYCSVFVSYFIEMVAWSTKEGMMSELTITKAIGAVSLRNPWRATSWKSLFSWALNS